MDPQSITRRRRHNIVIESSGNLQVSSQKTRYLLFRDQRGFQKIIVFRREGKKQQAKNLERYIPFKKEITWIVLRI